MKKLANLPNKNVYFTAIKLCDETNRMYKIMESAFGTKFESTDQISAGQFFETVVTSITSSWTDSKTLMEIENKELAKNAKKLP